tara:strand:- start:35 stop:208 length:174 start_codon:yes stop_codon:yes gene_type:complete
MTRARDMADAGKVINHLDDASSKIQTQIEAVEDLTEGAATQASVNDTAVAMAIALGG